MAQSSSGSGSSSQKKKIVSVLLTDRHGALDVRTFDEIDAGRRAFSYGSPLLAHVLYALVEKDALPLSRVGPRHLEIIGDEKWEVVSEYGGLAVASVKKRARRVLAGVSTGELLAGDISQEYAGSLAGLFRAATMPFRISGSAAKVLARQQVVGPKRPTWNAGMEVAVTALRSAAQNVPRSISVMRFFTDVSIPGAFLPSGALRFVDEIRWSPPGGENASDREKTTTQEVDFIWPKELTPDISASPFSYAYEISSKSFGSDKLASLLRERLRDVPVVLYFHGGAFALCGRGTHRELAFRLSLSSRCVVCVPEYRRPPEFTLEESAADVERAYVRLLGYGVAPGRIVFAGDSAGGGLALSLLRSLHATQSELPAGTLLFSPWVDLDEEDHSELAYKSRNSNQKFDFLPRDLIELFSAASNTKNLEEGDEFNATRCQQSMFFRRCSFDSLSSLEWVPPILVHVGQCEVLHDQVVSMFRESRKIGARVELVVWRDMVHVSPCFAAVHDTPYQQLRMAGAFVRAVTKPTRDDDNKLTPTYVQVEAISARNVTIADGINPLTLSFSSAFVAARFSGESWNNTDPCRSFTKNGDNTVDFEWGANGSQVVFLLGPLQDDHDEAESITVAIKASASFGSTVVLFETTVAIPSERDEPTVQLVNVSLGQSTLLLSVTLVCDESFVIPSRVAVDPPLRRDADSTEPARAAPLIELPTRVTLPPRPEQHVVEAKSSTTRAVPSAGVVVAPPNAARPEE